jgi:hypothetical protein
MFLLPSDGPALNVNCSIPACTLQQQRLISIQFNSSNITIAKGSSSSDRQIFVIPAGAIVSSAGSFASCSSSGNSPVAVFSVNDSYSTYVACRPCEEVFHIALTSQLFDIGNLQPIQNTDCLNLAFSNVSQSCPFGTALCTTSLSVTTGFWTNFTETNAAPYYRLNVVVLCPSGYCGCDSDSCLLAPPFSPDYRPDDALCTGNRMGVLCGGCKRGFTQSLDGVTCFSNDECAKNVGWTWAVTVIGYSLYAAYIVVVSLQQHSGLISCVLFYGQMSLFASFPQSSASGSTPHPSAISSWLARTTQLESVASLYSQTCYGMDMGAYAVTATQLSGPAIVLVISVTITLALKQAQPFMQRRDVKVSIAATLSTVVLFLFSSVTTVVVKLITCQADLEVVFIDGTVPCNDRRRQGLIAVLVILCIFPLLFAAALRWKRLPPEVQTKVCSAYSSSQYYWGAVTLTFRLVMSIVYATVREFPSVSAIVLSFLCFAMLLLLTYQKPYRLASTYHFDVMCHVCLVVQFTLEVWVRASESLGIISGTSSNVSSQLRISYDASFVVRCVLSRLYTVLP